jgi:hypothetical protein
MHLEIKNVVCALDTDPSETLVGGYFQRYENGMTVLVVDATNCTPLTRAFSRMPPTHPRTAGRIDDAAQRRPNQRAVDPYIDR